MMRTTTLKLSEEIIKALDQKTTGGRDRSEFVEAVLWSFIRRTRRDEQAQHDLDILNQNAQRLNEEATDVLEYQVNW